MIRKKEGCCAKLVRIWDYNCSITIQIKVIQEIELIFFGVLSFLWFFCLPLKKLVIGACQTNHHCWKVNDKMSWTARGWIWLSVFHLFGGDEQHVICPTLHVICKACPVGNAHASPGQPITKSLLLTFWKSHLDGWGPIFIG